MTDVCLHTLIDRIGAFIRHIHTDLYRIPDAALRLVDRRICIAHRSVVQSVSERIENILIRVTVCTIRHIIVREFRKIFGSLIKRNRKLSAWRKLAKQCLRNRFSSACSRIEAIDDRSNMLVSPGYIQRTSGGENKHNRLSDCRNRLQKFLLKSRKIQSQLVATGVFIAGIAFLSFDCCIQSEAKHNNIRLLCCNDSLLKTILRICQKLYLILVQMTSLRVKDTHIIPHILLNSFQRSDITGRGSEIVSNQSIPRIGIRSDDRDRVDLVFVKWKELVLIL